MKQFVPSLLFMAAICMAGSTATAQSRQIVVDQMDAAATAFGDAGFTANRTASGAEMTIGMLGGYSDVHLELWLERGRDYAISAACDYDCSDLDLILRSSTGATVAGDLETDDVPMLGFSVESTGRYLLEVSMVDCKTDLCYFGYRVFERS